MVKKTSVTMIVEHGIHTVIPLSMVWYDGRTYSIDRILDVQRAANTKVGGVGFRYKVRIRGLERILWRENDNWFVEEEVPDEG